MAGIAPETLDRWRGLVVVDRDGTTLGVISEFYLDRETGQPTWALIGSGMLGTRQTFVPLAQAVEAASAVRVPYAKQQVRTAPGIHPDGELTPEEEATLFAHYGMDYAAEAPEPEQFAGDPGGRPAGPAAPAAPSTPQRRLTRHPRPAAP